MGYRRKRNKYRSKQPYSERASNPLSLPTHTSSQGRPQSNRHVNACTGKGYADEEDMDKLAIEIFGGTFWCMNDNNTIPSRSE